MFYEVYGMKSCFGGNIFICFYIFRSVRCSNNFGYLS